MGTADWTNEKFSSFYWEAPAPTCSNTPVYETYRWRTRLLGFTYCSPAMWQLPIEAAGIQIKSDCLQVISWLQILVQALRSGRLNHHFHTKSLRKRHLNVFCATSTWLSDTFATWTRASLPFSNLSIQLSSLRNKEAGSSSDWTINSLSPFHYPFIPLSLSPSRIIPSLSSFSPLVQSPTLPADMASNFKSWLQRTPHRATKEITQRSYPRQPPQLNWTGLRASASFTTRGLGSIYCQWCKLKWAAMVKTHQAHSR